MIAEKGVVAEEPRPYYFAAQQTNANGSRFHLPRARTECATNPNDPCCMSCGQDRGDCPVDNACYVNGDPTEGILTLADLEDAPNLRCFDQKRRFGMDFLYPIDRYTQALTSAQITNRAGEIVDNPIFSDLNPDDDIIGVREPRMVLFAGIVGVPWQDIARDPSDLTLGFKSSDELNRPVSNFANAWDIILGNPAEHQAPADPFMIESHLPRTGSNPVTADAVSTSNNINGNEYDIPERDDLQYACVFSLPLGVERDCSIPGTPACDCEAGNPNNNPLCDPVNPQIQIKAKAYPGLRELSLIRSVGSQGIVGSVCPAQLSDTTRADFGYRPAVQAVVDSARKGADGACLSRSLPVDGRGLATCTLIEASDSGGECACEAADGRRSVRQEAEPILEAIREVPDADRLWDCYCEIVQLEGDEDDDVTNDALSACRHDVSEPVQLYGADVNGWCYIDAMTSPPIGDPEIITDCPAPSSRMIRFAVDGKPRRGAAVFMGCR